MSRFGRWFWWRRGAWAVVVALTTLAACGGGAQQVRLTAAPIVPAASGTLEVRQGEHGNSRLKLKIEHLAPPDKVAPGATAYVVWVKPDVPNAEPQNIGILTVDSSLKAELQTLTPFKSFELTVTPEASPRATQPSNAPVFRSAVQR